MWRSPTSLEQERVKPVWIRWSRHTITTNISQRCLALSRGKIITNAHNVGWHWTQKDNVTNSSELSVGTARRQITSSARFDTDDVTFYMYIYFDINTHKVRVWRWRHDLVYIYLFGYTYTYSARLTLMTWLFIHVHNLIYVYIYLSQRWPTPSHWAPAGTDASKR